MGDAGDIHKLPFEQREKYLEALGIEQSTNEVPDLSKKLNRVPSLISTDIEELRAHTEELAAKPGSEGNVAKKASHPYSLAGRDEAQIKFHNSAGLAGLVLMIESMNLRKLSPVPEVLEISSTGASFSFTRQSMQVLFDDLFDGAWVEIETRKKWSGKTPKRIGSSARIPDENSLEAGFIMSKIVYNRARIQSPIINDPFGLPMQINRI